MFRLFIFFISIILSNSLFIPSQTNCKDSICYSQTLFNPSLVRSSKSRCSEIDCINTFLVQFSNTIQNDTYQSNKNDQNKMMILVCSKLDEVNQITLSLNLNGEKSKNSFSFTFDLYKCSSDCADNLVEKIDSWIENKIICSAFRFRINEPYSIYKEILYVNRIGYYLTVETSSKDVVHLAKTNSFINQQTIKFNYDDQCQIDNCLLFRGENVNDQCVKRDDCTGKLIYNLENKFLELYLANPLNRTNAYYLILVRPIKGKKMHSLEFELILFFKDNTELLGFLISDSKNVHLIYFNKELKILREKEANDLITLEDESDDTNGLKWTLKVNYELFKNAINNSNEYTLRLYGGFNFQTANLSVLDFFRTPESKPVRFRSFKNLKSSVKQHEFMIENVTALLNDRTTDLRTLRSSRTNKLTTINPLLSNITYDKSSTSINYRTFIKSNQITSNKNNSLLVTILIIGVLLISVTLALFCILRFYKTSKRDLEGKGDPQDNSEISTSISSENLNTINAKSKNLYALESKVAKSSNEHDSLISRGILQQRIDRYVKKADRANLKKSVLKQSESLKNAKSRTISRKKSRINKRLKSSITAKSIDTKENASIPSKLLKLNKLNKKFTEIKNKAIRNLKSRLKKINRTNSSSSLNGEIKDYYSKNPKSAFKKNAKVSKEYSLRTRKLTSLNENESGCQSSPDRSFKIIVKSDLKRVLKDERVVRRKGCRTLDDNSTEF